MMSAPSPYKPCTNPIHTCLWVAASLLQMNHLRVDAGIAREIQTLLRSGEPSSQMAVKMSSCAHFGNIVSNSMLFAMNKIYFR